MAGAQPDRPLVVVLFPLASTRRSRVSLAVHLVEPLFWQRCDDSSTRRLTPRRVVGRTDRVATRSSGSGSEGWTTRGLDDYLRRNRWRVTSRCRRGWLVFHSYRFTTLEGGFRADGFWKDDRAEYPNPRGESLDKSQSSVSGFLGPTPRLPARLHILSRPRQCLSDLTR